MDERTLTALRGSIEKWRLIAEGVGVDAGHNNCHLCREFLYANLSCIGCPVRDETSLPGCDGTPYWEWYIHWTAKNYERCLDGKRSLLKRALSKEEKLLALNEYVYLLYLLPEGVYE